MRIARPPVGPLLLEPELVVTLGDQVAAVGVVAARQDVERQGQAVSGDLHGVGAVHLHPLVLPIQVDGVAGASPDQAGLPHDVGGNAVSGLVPQGADRLIETDADEIPESAAQKLGMRVDDVPVIIRPTTAVTGHGQVLVHE